MDIEEYLAREKQKLETDKIRLIGNLPKSIESYEHNVNSSADNEENNHFKHLQNDGLCTLLRTDSLTTAKENLQTFEGNDIIHTTSPCNNPFTLYDGLIHKYSCVQNLKNYNVADQGKNIHIASEQKSRKTDDMEQWVSDTFYSYFPSLSEESKRRKQLLRDQQMEYHQNNVTNNNSSKKVSKENHDNITTLPGNMKSFHSNKTDIEIIVNNPNIKGFHISPRPDSTRDKLLEDLRHTELSTIVNSDGILERNRVSAERELEKKKSYQADLMKQIEEKRREIKMIKEKDKFEEITLTRKLEEQLKTIELQEELSRENRRAEKVRFEREQNKIKRDQILMQLENDAHRFSPSNTELTNVMKNKGNSKSNGNKVYKYFSNSARREYSHRSRQTVDDEDLLLNFENQSERSTCYHCYPTICPYCNIKLKSYDNWCLRCSSRVDANMANGNLLCENCDQHYSICADCQARNSKCMYCQKKRNTCSNCTQNLCLHCGNDNNCANDVGNKVTKDSPDVERGCPNPSSERSFQILEVNYPTCDVDREHLNNFSERNRLPFSMNIDKNSLFHPDNNLLADNQVVGNKHKQYGYNNVEQIRNETNERLSRYFKNYADIATKRQNISFAKDSSTQTTSEETFSRKPYNESNLCMPLLREFPKNGTVVEPNISNDLKATEKIRTLEGKWDVPAVQRHTISNTSPKIITQLGAIRKQLQADIFQ